MSQGDRADLPLSHDERLHTRYRIIGKRSAIALREQDHHLFLNLAKEAERMSPRCAQDVDDSPSQLGKRSRERSQDDVVGAAAHMPNSEALGGPGAAMVKSDVGLVVPRTARYARSKSMPCADDWSHRSQWAIRAF
ncbi:hypothetical protein N9L68_00120 [bacterium]|nr:hypothetical protein [bacterium]